MLFPERKEHPGRQKEMRPVDRLKILIVEDDADQRSLIAKR